VSSSIEFAPSRRETAFGLPSDPRIPALVRTGHGPLRLRLLVDTGADFAVAPRRLADLVGLDWDAMPDAQVAGVGGGSTPVRMGRLPMSIGGHGLTVRCLFLQSERPLLILGRADFLDRFVLTIDQPQGRIALQPVDR
jgi:predicted aspartyl protease